MRWCNADEITPINTHERTESDPVALVFCIYVDTRRGRALFLRGHLWWISCVCLILSGRLWSRVWHNISPAAATNSQTKGSPRHSYRPQRGMDLYLDLYIFMCHLHLVSRLMNEVEVHLSPTCTDKAPAPWLLWWSGRKKNQRSRAGEHDHSVVKRWGIIAALHQSEASSSDGESSAAYCRHKALF